MSKNITDYSNFHMLIEIAVSLDRRIDEFVQYPSNLSRINLKNSQKRLIKWLRENYNDPGINRRIEKELINEKIS